MNPDRMYGAGSAAVINLEIWKIYGCDHCHGHRVIALSGPAYPFLWGHPVVPIYGDIFKNRHIAAYEKGANIAFLVYAPKTAKSYMI